MIGETKVHEAFWSAVEERDLTWEELNKGVDIYFRFGEKIYQVDTTSQTSMSLSKYQDELSRRAVEAIEQKRIVDPTLFEREKPKKEMKNQPEVESTIKNDDNKVWVNVERTVNLGNYENIKISVGESRTVGPDENPLTVRNTITNQCLDEADAFAEQYK